MAGQQEKMFLEGAVADAAVAAQAARDPTWQLGDTLQHHNRAGVLLGWHRGRPHVRCLDIDEWPEDIGTCQTWPLEGTQRTTTAQREFLMKLAFPWEDKACCFSSSTLRCHVCAGGIKIIAHYLKTGTWEVATE